jgi:hypothetical protein
MSRLCLRGLSRRLRQEESAVIRLHEQMVEINLDLERKETYNCETRYINVPNVTFPPAPSQLSKHPSNGISPSGDE